MYAEELSKCGALVATNEKLYKYGKSINPNTYLITNAIFLGDFPYIYRVKPEGNNFVVGFCGSIIRPEYREYKGYDLVVESCKISGVELKQALFKQGQIPHNKMVELFYSQIDCLLLPTMGEGCSNTIMEALSCGVPVITTRTAGFHGERLENGINVLFAKRDGEEISQAIEQLRNSPGLRMKLSHNGRKFAEQNHDITKLVKEWEAVIESVMNGGNNEV